MRICELKNLLFISAFTLLLSTVLAGQHDKNIPEFASGLVEDIDWLDLETGDLLLFQSKTFNGIMTQIGTVSPYTHCALVIRNPDGSLWLTHSTDNDYYGHKIPVINEPKGRSGIILTKLTDLFISTDGRETGFYKHIWIRKFDESWAERPSREKLLALYEKHKKYPFTKSKIPFIFSAIDFSILGYDLLSIPDDESFFCSEYLHHILKEAGYAITDDQAKNEYTPKDIRDLEPYYDAKTIVFIFENGMYRLN
ncbi:MAG: hypothetical protein IPH57_01435 [Saprospiraceae bacterium]|nr:hypothetical protein [Saprospiraceae bacterium]